ncbi:hypothetical protein P879_01226 [Paragonimus westermani]|uniref:FERM, RhoGEF and pleckstrin domain protein 2 n=1 Tax=Paragonimus westermani TaxID=34504 RepID=A0A8T0DV07_9TREM|nr:hypothetical protein P879_01226 [Paragonimus westermani]
MGQELYDQVIEHLQLVEYDYFDLEYESKDGHTFWLDHLKPVQKQHTTHKDHVFTFAVKFYTPHPNLLEDEFTRYLFALQIRKDLQNGRLPCSESTAALLAAYIAQGRIGDFLEDVYLDHSYLSALQLFPSPSASFLAKVAECHRNLVGQSPADADYNLLDTVRKVELYGIRMHPATDAAGLKMNLAVTHAGVLIYQGSSKINTFSWARIRKLSFKRKKFIIKLLSETYHTADFVFESRNECKRFWKQCIEHHAFFRCQAVRQSTTNRRGRLVVSKGSSFRYTGRTQKQLVEYVRENYVKMPSFERSASTGRVLNTPTPGLLLPGGMIVTQSTLVAGSRPDTGVQSDFGPSTRLPIHSRPQTDPAQRTHLTDSYLSPDQNRPVTITIPVLGNQVNNGLGHQVMHGTAQIVRQHRRCSIANEAALPGTLPRGTYLLSAMGTASSGSYTMNSSISAGSPAASNSSTSSPQADKRAPTVVSEFPAHFVLPSQLRMQDLTLRPLSVASLGPVVSVTSSATPVVRPSSPVNTPGVIIAQHSGPRSLGVAVLPTESFSTMHTSLLMSSPNSSVSPLGCGLPVIALGPSTSTMSNPSATCGLSPTRMLPAQSAQLVRLQSQPRQDASAMTEPVRLAQPTPIRLPPGYAVLAGATGLGPMGGRVIYIDRTTGRPLLLTSGGQLLLDTSTPITLRQSPVTVSPAELVKSVELTNDTDTTTSTTTAHTSTVTPGAIRVMAPRTSEGPDLTAMAPNPVEATSINGVQVRPRRVGPPPPAPERRESMFHRPSSAVFGHDPNQMPRAVIQGLVPSVDKSTELLDSGGEDDVSERATKVQHPLAMGLITGPNGLHSASCLSLAARGRSALSTRSLCMTARDGSDVTTSEEDDRVPEHRCRHHMSRSGGSQSDAEPNTEGCRHSLILTHANTILDEDDDKYSACSQRSINARSRSASYRRRHHLSHHHHLQQHPREQQSDQQPTRCQSAVDPAMEHSAMYRSSIDAIKTGEHDSPKPVAHPRHTHSKKMSRHHVSSTYHLICDLIMTERTYGRDLSVLCVCFRRSGTWLDEEQPSSLQSASSRLPNELAGQLYELLDPIYTEHQKLLGAFETRLISWNSGRKSSEDQSANESPFGGPASVSEQQSRVYRIGDLFLENLPMLPHYQKFMSQAEQLMMSIEQAVRSEPLLEQTMRQFEAQKVCYLPFYVFLLRPMHRLLQYRVALERLMRQYGETHPDAPDCRIFHARLLDLIQSQWEAYKRLENTYKLLEIQRDLIGLSPFPVNPTEVLNGLDAKGVEQTTVESARPPTSTRCTGPLPRPGRQFIREGWLQKLSKSGYQPRMFFLFSDQLVYASRTSAPFLQFKVHGQFPLYDLMVEEAEPAHSFTVFSGNLCFLVAAPSDWQRDRWLEDISRAILAAKTKPSSGAESTKGVGLALDGTKHLKSAQLTDASPTDQSQMLQRATTSVHVCWHRSFTYSMQDILRANEYETSGYLLRKFKNSNGWQRLWVVFTQNCLFFYKSYRDDRPLASLPLLGYTITTPHSDHDQIRQDGVIKLQFKNHVYFFRGESHHAFARWFEHLSNAAGMSRRPKV